MGKSTDTQNLISGGIVGGAISYVFQLLFSRLGAFIITIALVVAALILLTHFSFTSAVNTMGEQIVKIAKSIKNFAATKIFKKKAKPESSKRKIGETTDDVSETYLPVVDSTEDSIPMDIKLNGFKDPYQNCREENLKEEDFPFLFKKKNENSDAEDDGKPHIPEATLSGFVYNYPSIDLLSESRPNDVNLKEAKTSALRDARKLVATLKSFGVDAKVNNISRGPTVTRYELSPSAGVKVSRIVSLADDIALNLAAPAIRIEAPIPGKAAVGIEIPNKEVQTVSLREVIDTVEFAQAESKLSVCLGKDISGETVIADIAKMPHLLIAGSTGSGKSVCINSLIVSLLFKASPQELNFIMIDPKVVELGIYNGIPHLCAPVVTDPKKAAGALQWAVKEMNNRYKIFAESGVRDLESYNELVRSRNEENILPHYVIVIDELADLMMVAPAEVEDSICRLALMARAAGMHLVIATQRPSVDVITGVIKANIPSRIAFKVASQVDSRTILDQAGAEKLLGRGDSLFYPMGAVKPVRIQGSFISDREVENVVEFLKSQGDFSYNEEIVDQFSAMGSGEKGSKSENDSEIDELLPQAIELVIDYGQASVSFLQRRLKIGYSRAARIIDMMEERGIVSAYEGSKPRQVLISKEKYTEIKMRMEENS